MAIREPLIDPDPVTLIRSDDAYSNQDPTPLDEFAAVQDYSNVPESDRAGSPEQLAYLRSQLNESELMTTDAAPGSCADCGPSSEPSTFDTAEPELAPMTAADTAATDRREWIPWVVLAAAVLSLWLVWRFYNG